MHSGVQSMVPAIEDVCRHRWRGDMAPQRSQCFASPISALVLSGFKALQSVLGTTDLLALLRWQSQSSSVCLPCVDLSSIMSAKQQLMLFGYFEPRYVFHNAQEQLLLLHEKILAHHHRSADASDSQALA